ncbi:hypothetical protein [Sphingobium chungangianum]
MGALIEAGDHRRGGGNGWPQHSGAWGRRNMHWMNARQDRRLIFL